MHLGGRAPQSKLVLEVREKLLVFSYLHHMVSSILEVDIGLPRGSICTKANKTKKHEQNEVEIND